MLLIEWRIQSAERGLLLRPTGCSSLGAGFSTDLPSLSFSSGQFSGFSSSFCGACFADRFTDGFVKIGGPCFADDPDGECLGDSLLCFVGSISCCDIALRNDSTLESGLNVDTSVIGGILRGGPSVSGELGYGKATCRIELDRPSDAPDGLGGDESGDRGYGVMPSKDRLPIGGLSSDVGDSLEGTKEDAVDTPDTTEGTREALESLYEPV